MNFSFWKEKFHQKKTFMKASENKRIIYILKIDRIFMNKRGQVTVFIILGIIILAAIVLVFYLTGNTLVNQSEQKVNIETKPLKNYVGDCLEKTGNDALNLIGKQGELLLLLIIGYMKMIK